MVKTESFAKVHVDSVDALREWLSTHHGQAESVWLVTFKKHIPEKYISSSQVLDELLSFGWIDGVRRKLDIDQTMQLISPRKAQHWTRTYKDRATKLIDEGRMHISGLQAIQLSKDSGMWNFMDDVDNLIIPEDLASALSRQESANQFFHSINDSSKRFVLRWLKLTKTEATRQKRIAKLVQLSAKGQKLPGS